MIRSAQNTPVILWLFVILFAGSCTVQKRVHRKGWFVQWNHNRSESVNKINEAKEGNDLSEASAKDEKEHSRASKEDDKSVSEVDPNTENLNLTELKATERISTDADATPFKVLVPIEVNKNKSDRSSIYSKHASNNPGTLSPPRIPFLAWALLFIGCALIALAIVLGLVFLAANGSLIGASLYMGLVLIAGILFIAWATQTALAPLNSQPTPPDPRLEKEEPKREKKEREPLKKNDKIFLAVIAGLIVIIAASLLSY